MLHKSYVSEVVDPLSDHLANWHGSPDHGPDHYPVLDPISSNQAIGTATRPWITTPTARLSRTWAPILDYSSTWGN